MCETVCRKRWEYVQFKDLPGHARWMIPGKKEESRDPRSTLAVKVDDKKTVIFENQDPRNRAVTATSFAFSHVPRSKLGGCDGGDSRRGVNTTTMMCEGTDQRTHGGRKSWRNI